MKRSYRFVFCLVLTAGTLAAQSPQFTGIVNPASNLPPGLPNYGIALGSIFDIYGANLGPSTGVFAPGTPLPTTGGLSGTTVLISQNGGTPVVAPLLYVSAGQVVAVMPSHAPIGADTVTVNYNGKAGSSSAIVLQSNFGISTVSGAGHGAAVVTYGDYSLVTGSNSAKPGDTLVLWGTGLGAIAGSDAAPAAGGNINVPIQVFVGGVQASVVYQGRTPGAIGLDQINFVVPQNAPLGCVIGIAVQTNNAAGTPLSVSNVPTIALAQNGGACVDPIQAIRQTDIPGLLNKSVIRALIVQIENLIPDSKTAFAGFLSLSQSQAQTVLISNARPSLNTCSVNVNPGTPGHGLGAYTGLDAGGSVMLTPPAGGPLTVPLVQPGVYDLTNLSSFPNGIWTIVTPGGADVPATSFPVTVQQPIVWNNFSQLTSSPIDRTKPLQLTWTGGDANGYVRILGSGTLGPGNSPTYTAAFQCDAPAAAGSFTIPPSILLGLPTGPNAFAQINVWSWAYPAAIGSVAGFDVIDNESDIEQPGIGVVFR